MKLIVYEHITSGALCDEALPPSLAAEGEMMLSALVEDLLELTDIPITILRDARLPVTDWMRRAENITVLSSATMSQFQQHWQACLQEIPYFLLVAPETDNILLSLQQQVTDAGKTYIGCTLESTHLCSDKLRCYQQLRQADVPTPTTYSATSWLLNNQLTDLPWVVKPQDGAGCLQTMKFDSLESTRNYLSSFTTSNLNNLIVQPYISGTPLSLSLYLHEDSLQLLSINEQVITQQQQQLVFQSCVINSVKAQQVTAQQAIQLAQQVCNAIAGLSGYIGIDFMLTSDGPVVIEINPRLTTAYVGLSQSRITNPALPLWQHLQILNRNK